MPIIGKARRVDAVIHSPQHNKISQYIVDKGIQSECAEHPVMMIRISWPVIMNLEMDFRGKKRVRYSLEPQHACNILEHHAAASPNMQSSEGLSCMEDGPSQRGG